MLNWILLFLIRSSEWNNNASVLTTGHSVKSNALGKMATFSAINNYSISIISSGSVQFYWAIKNKILVYTNVFNVHRVLSGMKWSHERIKTRN